MSHTSLESWALTRKTIATVGALVLATALYHALTWIRRDITYWSRSTTFTYQSETLERCARLVVLNLPAVSISMKGKEIVLHVPGQEGVLVKPTATSREARLVVFGHSKSISTLGPPSEEPVNAFLRELSGEFTKWCN